MPAVDVRVVVQPEHRASGGRFLHAAVMSLQTLTPVLGAFPHASLTIVDPEWGMAPVPAGTLVVLERTPWWSSAASMTPELASARAVVRRYWLDVIDVSTLPPWFVDGLVEYTARSIVAPIFQGSNLGAGYAMLEPRYFGGLVPRSVPIRLLPESDGEPIDAYRASPRVDVTSAAAVDRPSLVAKTVLALNTLERWLNTPVLDGVLAEFARAFRHVRPTLADFMRTASAASGQDMSWLLAPAFGGNATYDYAITALSSAPWPGGGFKTTVTAARLGDGLFTGTAAPRIGAFESGRGLALATVFADGECFIDRWDGRDATRTFVYRSRAAAVSATIDPDRALVLDVHRTNNSRSLAPQSETAATRWAGRWMLWLEHALLTYAMFV